MNVLEKILEEINKTEEKYFYEEHSPMYTMGVCSMASDAKEIIRSHINEVENIIPCKKGDTVYELCKCKDGIYRIFPMIVKDVVPYGSPRLDKSKMPVVWNLYAEGDYAKMYKSFYDFGKTVFLTHAEAEAALKKMNKTDI